ncbi:MAG: hypothetical protein ABI112_17705 [Terracoccus sp.]
MSTKAEGNGSLVSGGAATLALAAAGWFALGLTTQSPRPPVVDMAVPASDGSDWANANTDASATAARGDRTRPTLHPEVRPAVVRQGESVVFLAHGADTGSGVASQACHTGRLPRFDRPGVHTVTCTVRDRAGNIAIGQTTYRVISSAVGHRARS